MRLNIRNQAFSSPSDLDYSISDRDRSEKKSLAQTMEIPNEHPNEKAISFGQNKFGATETFGKKRDSPRENLSTKEEKNKGWKMEFPIETNDKKEKKKEQKGWAMEFDAGQNKKRGGEEIINDGAEGGSLADLFQRKKKKMMEKYEQQKEQEKAEPKEARTAKTKEELLHQRKAMMEYKGPHTYKSGASSMQSKHNDSKAKKPEDPNRIQNPFADPKKPGKEPNQELLDRLAFGKKAAVSQKDMKALTSKNYDLLPEVKKKREEEKKKEEMRQRRENAKKLDQKLRNNSKTHK